MDINQQIEFTRFLLKEAREVSRLAFLDNAQAENVKKLNAILKTLEKVRDCELVISIPVTGFVN